MTKRRFTKPALSQPNLIAFLQGKGLTIGNMADAYHHLNYIGFYRLKIYMRPFEDASKQFRPGTTLDDIVAVYDFDRRLRLLCLDAIERIEVALRAHIINHMGNHGGPHFYYDERFFQNKDAVTRMRSRGEKGKHLSITHYKQEYYSPHLPPVWCITEASTFGELSRWYADLELQYRKDIATGFNFDQSICVSWFRSVSTLRNVCAHHGRLWNARIQVDTPKKAKAYRRDLQDNATCYARLVVLAALLKQIDPGNRYNWKPNLIQLINTRPASVRLQDLGFPPDWQARPLWV